MVKKTPPPFLTRTPLGWIRIDSVRGAVCSIRFVAKKNKAWRGSLVSRKAGKEILEFLNFKRKKFTFKTTAGGSVFNHKVWKELKKISFGKTLSYEAVAKAIGKPRAVRAVANAIAANPLLLVVPCHRVVRKNGIISGFSGGKWRKKHLLKLENSLPNLSKL